MKQLLIVFSTSILFAALWGEPVQNSVQSSNLFGSVKIDSAAENTFVAVPFADLAGGFALATNLVNAANLALGDKLYVYDEYGKQYDVFEVDGNHAWTAANKMTIGADGLATTSTASLDRLVAEGSGVILQRPGAKSPFYLYGQIPSNSSLLLGAGLSLVSIPGEKGVAEVDLNACTWTGVTASTIKKNSAFAIVTGPKDQIYYRDAANKVVRYYYTGSKWCSAQNNSYSEDAKIPAGTAFWFNHVGTGTARVAW